MPGTTRTLAFIVDQLDQMEGGYETQLREGILRQCRLAGVKLLLVAGRALEHPNTVDRVHNHVYELVSSQSVDGVILLSASLGRFGGTESIIQLVDALAPLPVCSIGMAVPGVPSITVDNATGVKALVDHLIRHHGARDLAFIGGPTSNTEASARLAAFESSLESYGLSATPELMLHGDFTVLSGLSETRKLLDAGVRCDAIVACNDAMAMGALDALREKHLRAPRDLLVVGFDNVASARHAMPPLTTARQPLANMGALAVMTLLDLLEGREVRQVVQLPVEPVIRRSCGCGSLPGGETFSPKALPSSAPLEYFVGTRLHLAETLADELGANPEVGKDVQQRLLSALERELGDSREGFVQELEDVVLEIGDNPEVLDVLQQAIQVLREELLSVSSPGLESLWHASAGAIVSALARSQASQRMTMAVAYERLRATGERFSTALNISALREALAEELPRLGVCTASISLYDENDPTLLRSLFCIVQGRQSPSRDEPFPARLLYPPDLPEQVRSETVLLLPLCFEVRNFGVAVFEFRASKTAYQMLREQISAAIRNIFLHEELLDMAAQRERNLQERIATAARMRSLSLLAGGVAHDLNNALGPLVVLPEMVQQELELGLARGGLDMDEMRADLDTIKWAATRAARTVKDLMTLGRQGNTKKQVLDLNEVVEACARTEPLRYKSESSENVKLVTELDPEPMPVLASEAHVARAIANLVRNAVEAAEGEGDVVVRTYRCTLKHPLAAYELVDAGDYVVVEVYDEGRGIQPEALQRIFEPFFSQKALRDTSGSGLGLAIVHGVVKEHGGFLDVESTPGEGTTFRLFLPRSRRPLSQRKNTAPLRPGKGAVLVVDDDPTQLRTAKRVLLRYGYCVTTAASATEALQIYERGVAECSDRGLPRQSGFDLVILDMALNDTLDGLETYERILAMAPQQRAMVASGHAPSDRAKLAVERGLMWLAKPYTMDALLSAVESVTGGLRSSVSSLAPPA